jgi:hypothetical protein
MTRKCNGFYPWRQIGIRLHGAQSAAIEQPLGNSGETSLHSDPIPTRFRTNSNLSMSYLNSPTNEGRFRSLHDIGEVLCCLY